MTDKPWTAPGLSIAKRALLLLGRPTQPGIEEAIEAAVRDAAPKWTAVVDGFPESKCGPEHDRLLVVQSFGGGGVL